MEAKYFVDETNYPDHSGLPLRVWIQCVPEVPLDDQEWTWSQWVVESSDPDPEMYLPGETVVDVQYARADVFDALLEACISIHQWVASEEGCEAIPNEPVWYQGLRTAIARATGREGE